MTTDNMRVISLSVALASVITRRRLVKADSSGNAVAVTAVGDNPVGVATQGSTDSQDIAIPVALLDGAILEIEAGGTVTAGNLVTMDSQGRVVNEVSGNKAAGVALNAGTSGDTIRVATASIASA